MARYQAVTNVEDAQKRVARIAQEADDAEVAHSLEDDFYRDVLRSIAGNKLGVQTLTEARRVAASALLTKQIDFPRWMA